MDTHRMVKWVEAHPTESILIGAGIIILILWLLGYFSGSSASSGSSNLASAYYAAEAQQAVVGGQIQMANINATASTAQTAMNDSAAQAIALAGYGAQVTINGQNASAAQVINSDQVNGAVAINAAQVSGAVTMNANDAQAATAINAAQVSGAVSIAGYQAQTQQTLGLYSYELGSTQANDQLLASQSNDAANLAMTQSNNRSAVQMNRQNVNSANYQALLGIVPSEMALTGGYLANFPLVGASGGQSQDLILGQTASVNPNINDYVSAGYTPAQALQIASAQGIFGSATPMYGLGLGPAQYGSGGGR